MPPKNNSNGGPKRKAIEKLQQQDQTALQQELKRLAKRVIAPLAMLKEYKDLAAYLLIQKNFGYEKWLNLHSAGKEPDPKFVPLLKGTVPDLRVVYGKIMRGEYKSRVECVTDIEYLWSSMMNVATGTKRLHRIWQEMYGKFNRDEKREKEKSTKTWDCNPLDKPVLRVIGRNYCACCTNPVSIV